MGTFTWTARFFSCLWRTVSVCACVCSFSLDFPLLLKCVWAAGGYACVWLIAAYHSSELDSPWLSEALLLVLLPPWHADDTKFVQQITSVCDALTMLQNGEF